MCLTWSADIVPATNYQKWGHAPVRPGIYPCCFTQWVGRSKDLKAWVDSTANPILGFPGPHDGPGNGSVLPGGAAGDRAVIPGSVLDQFGSAAAKEMCHNKTDDVRPPPRPAHPSPANHVAHTTHRAFRAFPCADQPIRRRLGGAPPSLHRAAWAAGAGRLHSLDLWRP